MVGRRVDFERKMAEFIDKKGTEIKAAILQEAQSELKKIENIRKVKEADLMRRKRDEENAAKRRAEGKIDETLEEDGTLGIGWGRNQRQQPEVVSRGGAPGAPREDGGIMTRQAFG
jgi:hypothetical protein